MKNVSTLWPCACDTFKQKIIKTPRNVNATGKLVAVKWNGGIFSNAPDAHTQPHTVTNDCDANGWKWKRKDYTIYFFVHLNLIAGVEEGGGVGAVRCNLHDFSLFSHCVCVCVCVHYLLPVLVELVIILCMRTKQRDSDGFVVEHKNKSEREREKKNK